MGEPVRIWDLALTMIRLRGKTAVESDKAVSNDGMEVCIVESGIRPGEKLYEELLIAIDGSETTPHLKILKARESKNLDNAALALWLSELEAVRDHWQLLELLATYDVGCHQEMTTK